MLSKKQILSAKDIKSEVVHVPEWATDGDDAVMVFGLNGNERDEYEASIVEFHGSGKKQTQTMNMQRLRAKLCSMVIRNPDGSRMFDEDEVDILGAKSAPALQRVFEAGQRLSGITEEEVEALAKNFASEENAGSGSASL